MSGPRTEFVGGTYDEAAGCWKAVVRRADGTERTLSPRHLIFANGVSGLPRIPSLPGLDEFAGEVVHSHSFTDGSPWRGKKVLVLGTGNSGHDIAQELHSHGADTTIIQRGSTTVVTVDPSAKLNYALYDEGPLEDCDLLASANTYPLVVRGYQLAVERMVEFDKEMIAGLIARGFKYDIGEDKTGHQMKYRRRGGGYYLDVGCSGLIISGEIRLLQFDQIERFVAEGARLKDGSIRPADLLVLATGYYTPAGPRAPFARRRRCGARRTDLGLRSGRRNGEHVEAHAARGPVVHCRRPRAMPHLFEIPRPANQGDRRRPAAEAIGSLKPP